ncbi:MAG: hypothetical protein CMF55_04200 [Legionellales bacterium]|nr:hypothetical protein [Legionellales bacterium]
MHECIKKLSLKQNEISLLIKALNKYSHSICDEKTGQPDLESNNLTEQDLSDLITLKKLLDGVHKLPLHTTLGDVIKEQDEYWKNQYRIRNAK